MTGVIVKPALSRRLCILNQRGLHARASAKFVTCANGFDVEIEVSRDDTSVCGTSIMGLMMLAASPGCHIDVTARGPEAVEALDALEKLVNGKFGEAN